MKNIFNTAIECTDPDQLQFSLKISDNEFWYCEPNCYHNKLLPESDAPEKQLLERYLGYPQKFVEDAQNDEKVKAFVSNRLLWLSGSSEMGDFTEEEKLELLESHGYSWDDFQDDADRNQIICEIYFEQNPMDFRNDI